MNLDGSFTGQYAIKTKENLGMLTLKENRITVIAVLINVISSMYFSGIIIHCHIFIVCLTIIINCQNIIFSSQHILVFLVDIVFTGMVLSSKIYVHLYLNDQTKYIKLQHEKYAV